MAPQTHLLTEPPRVASLAPDTEPHAGYPGHAAPCRSIAKLPRDQDLLFRSRPDNESVTPPRRPFSFTFCRSRSLSACLASFFA
jgi:hypothetical protein